MPASRPRAGRALAIVIACAVPAVLAASPSFAGTHPGASAALAKPSPAPAPRTPPSARSFKGAKPPVIVSETLPNPGTATLVNPRASATPPWHIGPAPGAPAAAGRVMNFVAHEDDDLLFMSPDVADWIKKGMPSRTVFLTAGEFNGLANATREQYSASREDGIRAAYAAMAGVANSWTRSTEVINGRTVEVDTLNRAPNVQVEFLCLPDGGDSLQSGALTGLLDGTRASATTIIPTGNPVTSSYQYARADVINTLSALIRGFQPTVVRTMDPYPNPQFGSGHPDHVAAARFTQLALAGYQPTNGHVSVVAYRDYNTLWNPQNLTPVAASSKQAVFNIYNAYDPQANGVTWNQVMYYRWPAGSSWVGQDRDGRLEAYAVLDGKVYAWWQTSPGGPWAGPASLGAPGVISPHLAVGTNADGRLQIFALRTDTHTLVTAWQTWPSLGYSGWASLGNPQGTSGTYLGPPATGNNADGRLEVWIRNSNGGLSTIYQTSPNGAFGGWVDLGGGPNLNEDAPTVVRNNDGRVEVFASTPTGVVDWYQTAPNGGMAMSTALPAVAPASAPTAAKNSNGLLALFYRNGGNSDVRQSWQAALNGGWGRPVSDLGAPGGVGDVAVAPASDNSLLLAVRGADLGVSVARQSGPSGPFAGTWSGLGLILPGTPTAAREADGRITLFAIGSDGRLMTNTQVAAGAGQAFGGWKAH